MSSTFTLYKPVVAPGAITHAVSCNFTGAQSQDLVVVRDNFIELFALAATAAASAAAAAQPSCASGTTDRPLLHRKMDKQMYGNVEGIW